MASEFPKWFSSPDWSLVCYQWRSFRNILYTLHTVNHVIRSLCNEFEHLPSFWGSGTLAQALYVDSSHSTFTPSLHWASVTEAISLMLKQWGVCLPLVGHTERNLLEVCACAPTTSTCAVSPHLFGFHRTFADALTQGHSFPGWSQTPYVTEDDFKFLRLLILPLVYWEDYRQALHLECAVLGMRSRTFNCAG